MNNQVHIQYSGEAEMTKEERNKKRNNKKRRHKENMKKKNASLRAQGLDVPTATNLATLKNGKVDKSVSCPYISSYILLHRRAQKARRDAWRTRPSYDTLYLYSVTNRVS